MIYHRNNKTLNAFNKPREEGNDLYSRKLIFTFFSLTQSILQGKDNNQEIKFQLLQKTIHNSILLQMLDRKGNLRSAKISF